MTPSTKPLSRNTRARRSEKKEIEEEARTQRTQWEEVLEIFNQRFVVPFKLTTENRVNVMLGAEPMLVLGFVFEDGADTMSVEKPKLMEVLSTGEKRLCTF
jgi:hypothetical protein